MADRPPAAGRALGEVGPASHPGAAHGRCGGAESLFFPKQKRLGKLMSIRTGFAYMELVHPNSLSRTEILKGGNKPEQFSIRISS